MHSLSRSFLIGVVAGLRTMTAPCAVSWAISEGRLAGKQRPGRTPLLAALAVGEYVGDTLPMTGSRTRAAQFGARLVSGGWCGMAVQGGSDTAIAGLLAGLCGAAVGTFGGAAVRKSLAGALGRDLPAALIEDAFAISAAAALVASLPETSTRILRSKQRK